MNNDVLDEIKKTNRLLTALLTITVDRHLRETDLAKPRPRSIDRMLADIGLQGAEIAKLLGKTPQAVSAILVRDEKKGGKKAKPADTDAPAKEEAE